MRVSPTLQRQVDLESKEAWHHQYEFFKLCPLYEWRKQEVTATGHLQVDSAIQEHMRLRNTMAALRQFKDSLVIQAPKGMASRPSIAEPFSKWLEEDPAEAFLTFDNIEECKPSCEAEGQRKSQGMLAASASGM